MITLATNIMGVITDGIPRIPGYTADVQNQFHNVFDRYGIDAQYYVFSVPPEELANFVTAAKTMRMPGFGVTMPHKHTILPYIDHLSEDSAACEAVNLVIIRNGETYGYMTDGTGYCAAWDRRGVQLEGRKVTIIGAGAIVPIICYELAKRKVAEFTILNRSTGRAENTAAIIRRTTGKPVTVRPLTTEELIRAAADTQLLLQASAIGMSGGQEFEDLSFLDHLPKGCLVSDVVVTPVDTKFLQYARAAGFETTDGADMICNQMPETMERYYPEVAFENDVVDLAMKAYRP